MKQLALLFQIAKTHLLARKKQTITATLGVTFGLAIFITMIGFMTGVNKLLEDTTLSQMPHIRIFNEISADNQSIVDRLYPQDFNLIHHIKPKMKSPNLKDAGAIINLLRSDSRVYGISPQINSQVFYNYGLVEIPGNIVGVDIVEENKLFQIGDKVKSGNLTNVLTAYNGILMGTGLAKKMNASVGDRVQITTPRGKNITLTIAGIFKTGIAQLDNGQSYATLKTVQTILDVDNQYITSLLIKLNDLNQAPELARIFSQQIGYQAENWQTANATIMFSFKLRNTITYSVVFALLIVAGFGIYNILTMMIIEKMKDIAILKAMGFSGMDVRLIFMMEAMTIGALGVVSGLTLGFIMSYSISKIPFESDQVIIMDHLPVNFELFYYCIALIFGLLTTTFAGYFPSAKAARVDPVEIIRG